MYPEAHCCDGFTALGKGFNNRLAAIQQQLTEAIWNNKETLSIRAKLLLEEGMEFIDGLFTGWSNRRLDVAYNAPDHLALSMMEFNLIEFAASKTEARLAAMNDLIINKDKLEIRSFADFKREAEKVTLNFNKTWLETEYNLAIAVGQSSANYFRFMDQKDSVTSYVQYQTIGDSKVREEHQLLDGRVFNLNDKSVQALFPPNGYNCRCEMLQYVDDPGNNLISGKQGSDILGDGFKESNFNTNFAASKKVFSGKQFYTNDGEILNNINKLDYESFGQEKYADFKTGLSRINLDTSITPKNVSELFKPDGKIGKKNFMGFEDYLKRKIILKETLFKKHTSAKYVTETEKRHQLFAKVKDGLIKPDEVWMHTHNQSKQSFQLRYIKYYNDEALIVEADIAGTGLEIMTWYGLKTDEKTIRKGLLIKKRKA